MTGAVRAAPRLVAFLAWTALLIPVHTVALTLGLSERIPVVYHRVVCRIIGLRVERRGEISQTRPTLFVCNHSSYLDISVLGSLIHGFFVARHDVASWPLFGLLAKLQRSVFVERRARHAADQRDEMGERLAQGDSLILFPEGSSNDGNRVLPFKSALLSVAERTVEGAPLTVQPVSVAYTGLGGMPMMRRMRPFFAWYGDMELAGHLWRVLGLGPATVMVEFHPPVTIDRFGSRKALAAYCHRVIAAGVSKAIHGAPPRAASAGAP